MDHIKAIAARLAGATTLPTASPLLDAHGKRLTDKENRCLCCGQCGWQSGGDSSFRRFVGGDESSASDLCRTCGLTFDDHEFCAGDCAALVAERAVTAGGVEFRKHAAKDVAFLLAENERAAPRLEWTREYDDCTLRLVAGKVQTDLCYIGPASCMGPKHREVKSAPGVMPKLDCDYMHLPEAVAYISAWAAENLPYHLPDFPEVPDAKR